MTLPLWRCPCDGMPRSRMKRSASSIWRPNLCTCDMGKPDDFFVYFRPNVSFHWDFFFEKKKYVKLSINVKGQALPYKWVPLDCRVDWRAWRDMHNDEYPSDKNLSLERDKCRDAEASQEAPWERLVGFPSLAVLLRQRNWEVREVMSSNDLSLSENVHQLVP